MGTYGSPLPSNCLLYRAIYRKKRIAAFRQLAFFVVKLQHSPPFVRIGNSDSMDFPYGWVGLLIKPTAYIDKPCTWTWTRHQTRCSSRTYTCTNSATPHQRGLSRPILRVLLNSHPPPQGSTRSIPRPFFKAGVPCSNKSLNALNTHSLDSPPIVGPAL